VRLCPRRGGLVVANLWDADLSETTLPCSSRFAARLVHVVQRVGDAKAIETPIAARVVSKGLIEGRQDCRVFGRLQVRYAAAAIWSAVLNSST
jgi:hypothetical protein